MFILQTGASRKTHPVKVSDDVVSDFSADVRFWLIILHIGIGILLPFLKGIGQILSAIVPFLMAAEVIRTKNRNDVALLFAVYLSCAEMVIRTNGINFIYEYGKYFSGLIIIIGLYFKRPKPSWPLILYFVCLLPSVLLVKFDTDQARKSLSFNMSGPLLLFLMSYYCYSLKVSRVFLGKILFLMFLPLLSEVIAIIIKLPSLSTIEFTSQSNKVTSGGFSPNQVSVAMGLGFLVVFFSQLVNLPVIKSKLVNTIMSGLFLAAAAFTFSRGGLFTSLGLALILTIYYVPSSANKKEVISFLKGLISLLLIIALGFIVLNELTGNKLLDRFTGRLEVNTGSRRYIKEQGLDVSGRDEIALADLDIFLDNIILGVGPGQADELREKYVGNAIGAHTEFTRLLVEHGLYGLISLCIELILPIVFFLRRNTYEKIMIITFVGFSLLSQAHAGMRIALISTCFAIGLLQIDEHNNTLESQKVDS